MIWTLLTVLCFVLLAGYFAGTEIGMYSVNRLRVRFRAEQGERGAVILQGLASNMNRVLATTLVGTNLAIYTATALMTGLFDGRGFAHSEVLATALLAPVGFVLAELIPKDLFQRRREALMCPLAAMFRFFTWLLWPIVAPLRAVIALLLAGLRQPREESDVLFSRQGLTFSLTDADGLGRLTPTQRRMARNIMQVERLTVGDVFRPLEDADMLPVHAPPPELLERARQRHFSRFPVYEGNPSNVIGTVNVFDLLCEGGDRPDSLRPYVKPTVLLDRQTGLHAALLELRAARQRMGIVADGSRAVGFVTIDDLVHQIVGKLEQQPDH